MGDHWGIYGFASTIIVLLGRITLQLGKKWGQLDQNCEDIKAIQTTQSEDGKTLVKHETRLDGHDRQLKGICPA